MGDPIYLDNNATTPLLAEVIDAMLPYLREHFGNPSSSHVYGQRARAGVDRARAQVAALLGCAPGEVYFTSGGTEANNLAIRGTTAASDRRQVVTSVIEHPATANPCGYLEEYGWEIARLGVDAAGRVKLDEAKRAIGSTTALVTVMHANNEVGTIQPIAELADLARAHGALVHTDAAQSLGKIPVDVDDLGVDLLSVAGHKLYAPKGVGALYVREGTPIRPVVLGAGHESGLRPGTENVASIVGLGAACAIAHKSALEATQTMRELRDELWARLHEAIPGAAVNGDLDQALPNTLNVRFPGVMGHELLDHTPTIAASTGSACHDGQVSASAVLLAMGIPADQAVGAVRLSLGRHTTRDDVARAAAALISAWREL